MAPFVIPLSTIAEWPKSNYIDPVTRGPTNLILNCVFIPIVALIVSVRIYTRVWISKSFGLDDWLIIAAFIPATAFSIISLMSSRFGWDKHIWDLLLTNNEIQSGLKLVMISQVMFCLASTATKLSMLALTWRILTNGSNRQRPLVLAAGIVIACEGLLFSFLVIFQCRYELLHLSSITSKHILGFTLSDC